MRAEPPTSLEEAIDAGKSALKPIHEGLWLIGGALTLAAHLSPALAAVLGDKHRSVLHLLSTTLPVSLAFAFLALALLRGWYWASPAFAVVFYAIALVCAWLGIAGDSDITTLWSQYSGTEFVSRLMSDYALRFGIGPFVWAMIVGLSTPVVWQYFVFPKLQRID